MDINYLSQYAIPVIVGICICVGYILKSSFPMIDNKHIPTIMGILGVALNVWIMKGISPDIILGGLFSGLASTGLHQLFKSLIEK